MIVSEREPDECETDDINKVNYQTEQHFVNFK